MSHVLYNWNLKFDIAVVFFSFKNCTFKLQSNHVNSQKKQLMPSPAWRHYRFRHMDLASDCVYV